MDMGLWHGVDTYENLKWHGVDTYENLKRKDKSLFMTAKKEFCQ